MVYSHDNFKYFFSSTSLFWTSYYYWSTKSIFINLWTEEELTIEEISRKKYNDAKKLVVKGNNENINSLGIFDESESNWGNIQ